MMKNRRLEKAAMAAESLVAAFPSGTRMRERSAEVIIVGGGIAGLSAAIYLTRAKRDTLIIDDGKSMARWEPDVQNYLGFPKGIAGPELLERAWAQARRYGTRSARGEISAAHHEDGGRFTLRGERLVCRTQRLLLCTGIFHIPPDLPGLEPCLGHSMFFCKDCDGYRVQGKTVAVYGWTDEAVRYALAMLPFSPCVLILTDGRPPQWREPYSRYVKEYAIPVHTHPISEVRRQRGLVRALVFSDSSEVLLDSIFTTRGDVYYNGLAKSLGAEVDAEGQVIVDVDGRTTVPGLYAAGCVTPSNCQLIIAAGQGATAAQAINTDLFWESLRTHSLKRFRRHQLRNERTRPPVHRRATAKSVFR